MITTYKFFNEKSNIFLDKIINRSKLDNTLNEDSFKDETNIAFRTILKNNGENKYLFIDEENSIKTFFNQKTKEYLDKHIDLFLSNEDIAIFVTKSNFDILFSKKENEINSNVVLVINEFEFIFNELSKSKPDKTYEDINLKDDIKEKITKIKQNINSLDKKFDSEKNNLFLSDIKFTEIFELSDYLIEKKKTISSATTPPDTNLDFKDLFFSQPSQQKKTKKDFSDYSRIDMSFLNKKRNKEENEKHNNENNKEEKKEEEKEKEKEQTTKEEVKRNNESGLPEEIKNLIEKNKDKLLKADTFEEYKNYRKLNIKWD